jgi:hypothetical protein
MKKIFWREHEAAQVCPPLPSPSALLPLMQSANAVLRRTSRSILLSPSRAARDIRTFHRVGTNVVPRRYREMEGSDRTYARL